MLHVNKLNESKSEDRTLMSKTRINRLRKQKYDFDEVAIKENPKIDQKSFRKALLGEPFFYAAI